MSDEIDLVNVAKAAWAVVEDGKPNASAKSAYCQAMPSQKQLGWEKLAGWQTKATHWNYQMFTKWDNIWGLDPTIDIDFQLQYDYGGTTADAKGFFLNNFTVWCSKCDVDWGWTVNVDATTQGNPKNVGTVKQPVGALQLRVALEYKSKLQSHAVQWAITCDGKGGFAAA